MPVAGREPAVVRFTNLEQLLPMEVYCRVHCRLVDALYVVTLIRAHKNRRLE